MKKSYFFGAFLTLLVGGAKAPDFRAINPNILSGNINLNLKQGVWRLLDEKPIYQDLELYLSCEQAPDGDLQDLLYYRS